MGWKEGEWKGALGHTTRKVLPIIAELAISREMYREVGEQLGRNAKFAHAEGRKS